MTSLTPTITSDEVRHLKRSVLQTDRSNPQLGRKFYHLVMGLLCFTLYALFLTREEALVVLGVIGGTLFLCDLVRLRNPQFNALALRLFGKIMRREELKSISGNSFYILGLLTVVLFFPKPIVLLSVLYLAVGDPAAAIVGTRWGKTKILGKKSLEGSIANGIAAFVATALFGMFYLGLSSSMTLRLSLLGALTSMVVELIPTPLDDNFTIPVGTALVLTAISSVIPLF